MPLQSATVLVAKSPWQVTESLAEQVLREQDAERVFIRILSWCATTGVRYTAAHIAATSPEPF
ncbi:MAG: hypothetical protein KA296_16920 [Marinobacter sp.]|nr:hypothetical protein [Marinobacter sp.]